MSASPVSESVDVAAFSQESAPGEYTLTLLVEGIHCASCIQLIENALHAEPAIRSARVNMSTSRLTFSWTGEKTEGNALAAIVTKLGYHLKPFDHSTETSVSSSQEKFLLRCIAICGFAAGNMMLISVALWSTTTETMGLSTRDMFHWFSALIALPAILYGGQPFFSSALSVLKEGRTNMDVPISLAVLLAGGMSLSETIRHGEHVYFDSAVMLLFFLLIGRYLDARAKGKARQSAQELLSMLSGTATILTHCGHQKTIPIRELREGMTVLVAMGENIPADGTVMQGNSEIDLSLITGETLPQHITEGDAVFAGTTNLSAPLRITVSKASDDSMLSDIVKWMEKAEQGQARYVRLADKAARLYTPLVHTLGTLTFFGWWLGMGEDWQVALLHGVTVLIITCPCALGLAVPVVQVLASSRLMKRGILLKSGDALEKLAIIDTAVFDKTGTLTIGKPELIQPAEPVSDTDMQLAASLASHSKHPLSQAVAHAYEGTLLPVGEVEEIPGKGLHAAYDGKEIRLGNRDWCKAEDITHHAALELWLAVEGRNPVQFTFADHLRKDAAETIARLQESGIRTLLLSGDREATVETIAKEAGIDTCHAALSPVEKSACLERLKQEGHHLLMAGDGLNDAPSLATANVSISPSTAVDITQNTADIVFQGNKLKPVLTAWQIARKSNRLVKQNFILAVFYNIIAIPLAILGHVTPLIAAIAMSASSLLVIGNSFRLNLMKES